MRRPGFIRDDTLSLSVTLAPHTSTAPMLIPPPPPAAAAAALLSKKRKRPPTRSMPSADADLVGQASPRTRKIVRVLFRSQP